MSIALLLRSDLHFSFDWPKFMFFSKGKDKGRPIFVTHVITPSDELVRLYHNTALGAPRGLSGESLFARLRGWYFFSWRTSCLTAPDDIFSSTAYIMLSRESKNASPEQCGLHTKRISLRSGSQSLTNQARETSSTRDAFSGDQQHGQKRLRLIFSPSA
jgi:hypothetical protein